MIQFQYTTVDGREGLVVILDHKAIENLKSGLMRRFAAHCPECNWDLNVTIAFTPDSETLKTRMLPPFSLQDVLAELIATPRVVK